MTGSRFSFKSFLGFIFKMIFFLILLGVVLGGVWIYSCVFKFPEIPDVNLPDKVEEYWEIVIDMQNTQCGDMGYWFGKDATRNQKLIEQNLNPPEEGEEKPAEEVVEVEEGVEECGNPGIEVKPSEGVIGETFTIYLKGFTPNDVITACWYYPNGEEINCTELEANGDGFRETIFWSEKDDPPGEYGMTATGKCGLTEVSWMILERK